MTKYNFRSIPVEGRGDYHPPGDLMVPHDRGPAKGQYQPWCWDLQRFPRNARLGHYKKWKRPGYAIAGPKGPLPG